MKEIPWAECMDLRDYFAAAVLTNLSQNICSAGEKDFNGAARSCYELADAMLAEREKKNDNQD